MTPHELYGLEQEHQAEAALLDWARISSERDARICNAHFAGVSQARIAKLTGVARTTIKRILAEEAERPPF